MRANDVTATLEDALVASGCDTAVVAQRPRLLSDNGSSYISGDLAEWLKDRGMDHVRGAPNHPQTQGKTERWHQTLKNRILLENYYLPGALEHAIGGFVDHYNNHRYHERLWQPDACGRLLRPSRNHPQTKKGDQTQDNRTTPLVASAERGINSTIKEPDPSTSISPPCPKSSDDGQFQPLLVR